MTETTDPREVFWLYAEPAYDRVDDLTRARLNAALDAALAAAGRLATNGGCGHRAPTLALLANTLPATCKLTAGHTGWHRGDDDSEWAECTCPTHDVSTLADLPGTRTMPGLDPTCPIHGNRADQTEPARYCHNCGHACAHNPPHPLIDTPNGPVCADEAWCRQLRHADETAKSCPCLPGAPPHVHGVGGYATTQAEG